MATHEPQPSSGIAPKSEHQLQAQAEAYAESRRTDETKRNVYLDLGDNLTKNTTELRQIPEYHEYLRWLRDREVSEPAIQDRLEAIQAYEPFREEVRKLLTRLNTNNFKDLEQSDGFVAQESVAVFKIQLHGKSYAVRFDPLDHRYRHRQEQLESYSSPLLYEGYYQEMIAGKGIPHLEQVIAFSAEDGVVISELVAGKTGTELDYSDYKQITDRQVKEILSVIIHLDNTRIWIDSNSKNWIFHPQTGFTVIDYFTPLPKDHPFYQEYTYSKRKVVFDFAELLLRAYVTDNLELDQLPQNIKPTNRFNQRLRQARPYIYQRIIDVMTTIPNSEEMIVHLQRQLPAMQIQAE